MTKLSGSADEARRDGHEDMSFASRFPILTEISTSTQREFSCLLPPRTNHRRMERHNLIVTGSLEVNEIFPWALSPSSSGLSSELCPFWSWVQYGAGYRASLIPAGLLRLEVGNLVGVLKQKTHSHGFLELHRSRHATMLALLIHKGFGVGCFFSSWGGF